MKKYYLIFILCFVLISCESNKRNNMLREQRYEIQNQISKLKNICQEKKEMVDSLDAELQERKIVLEGKTPVYTLRCCVHFSRLDSASRHDLRDVQDAYFDIPVSRWYYKKCKIGEEILDEGGGFFSSRVRMRIEIAEKFIN